LTQGWDGTARLWALRTGVEVRRFDQDAEAPAIFSDDRTILGRWKSRWHLWDRTTGKAKALPGDLARCRGDGSCMSADGRILLTADHQIVTLWAWPAGKQLRKIRTNQKVNKALVTADGRTVLVLGEEGRVTLWDRQTGKQKDTLPLRVGMYPQL